MNIKIIPLCNTIESISNDAFTTKRMNVQKIETHDVGNNAHETYMQ